MKRKNKKNDDIIGIMTTIQEQLAVLDNKLDAFMTKSLTELAQALAASKPASNRSVPAVAQENVRPIERHGRPMYSVICFECGEDCEIPFRPSGNRPVYCKKCFAKRKGGYTPKPSASATLTSSTAEFKPLAPKNTLAPETKHKKKAVTKKTAAKKKVTAKKKPTTKKKTVAKKKKAVKKKAPAKKKIVRKKTATKKRSKK